MTSSRSRVLRNWSTILAILTCSCIMCIERVQEFTVEPVSVVQAEGLEAVFECLYPRNFGLNWRINSGSFLSNDDLPSNFTGTPSSGDTPARLTIPALPQYNNTVVQCRAIVGEGGDLGSESSRNATLVVQDFGPLLTNLTSPTSVVIFWRHLYPPSVDYHVDVRGPDGLLDQSQLVNSNDTGSTVMFTFTATANRGICEQYSITVTPTDGKRNSTFVQRTEQYLSSEQSAMGIDCVNATGEIQCNINFSSSLVAGVCYASLTLSSSADEDPLLGDVPEATVELVSNGQQHMVTLPSNFPSNRLYTANTIIKINGLSEVINSQTISTHDIVSATAAPGSDAGSLDTSATFVPGTTATGYLAIIDDQTCSEAIFLAVYDTSGATDNLKDVGPGSYTAALFDIESDGLPMISGESDFTGAAAMMDVSLSSGKRNSSLHRMPASDGSFSIKQLDNEDIRVVCQSGACLFLLYNCDNPDVLTSVKVDQTGTSGEIISESDLPATTPASWIGAVFLFDNETSHLSRHPVEIQFFSFAAPTVPTTTIVTTETQSTSPSSTTVAVDSSTLIIVASASSVGVLLMACMVLVGVLCCCFRRRKRSKCSQTNLLSHTNDSCNTRDDCELDGLPEDDVEPAYDVAIRNTNPTSQQGRTAAEPTYNVTFRNQTAVSKEGAENIESEYAVAFHRDRKPFSTQNADNPESDNNLNAGLPDATYDVAFTPKLDTMAVADPTYDLAFNPERSQQEAVPDPTYDDMAIPNPATGATAPDTGQYSYAVVGAKSEPKGLIYSDVKASSDRADKRPLSDVMEVQYAVLDSTKLVTEVEPPDPKPPEPVPALPPKPTPLTVDTLHTHLSPAAEKWRTIGKAMGILQRELDKIDGDNSTDWLKLRQLCSVYTMMSSSWTDVVQILWSVEEWELADAVRRRERLDIERPVNSNSQEELPALPPKTQVEKTVISNSEEEPPPPPPK